MKKTNYKPDKQKSYGRSFKKNLAVAAVAASLGVSLGVPVQDVLAGEENITTKDEKNISSVQGKIESNQGKFKSNQVKIEANQGKFKSNQGKIESNQGKFKADQIKGEVTEQIVQ
jgi:peptidoglycan hydrolase CwlO-like protein